MIGQEREMFFQFAGEKEPADRSIKKDMRHLTAAFISAGIFFAAAFSAIPARAANVVAIDPGHQGEWVNMSDTEPMAPGSSEMKAKASTGTTGRFTGVPEYQLNLDISLKLRDELKIRGYEVIMTREDNDTAISNSERALMAADQGGDVYVRIHANGSDDPSVNGALAMTMSPQNPYVGNLYEQSYALAGDILNIYCQETGFANLGIQYYDNMTGINWSRIPVMILEMGFMTNESDDRAMQDPEMQKKMVKGIADGLDAYFAVYGEDPWQQTSEAAAAQTSENSGDQASGSPAQQTPDNAGTQAGDSWQDVGIAGNSHKAQSEASQGASSQSDASQNETSESETQTEVLQAVAGLGDMVYEQFVFSREMMGEKWAVAYVRPEKFSFDPVPGQEQVSEAITDAAEKTTGSADEKGKPEKTTEPAAEAAASEKITEPVTEAAGGAENAGSAQKITGTEDCWMINGEDVLQSASVIKIFIMGSVYDRICYPSSPEKEIPYTEAYEGELRETLESMITVSSNEAANKLIDILGQGDTEAGKKVVDRFCEEHGYRGVHLGRKFLESNPTDDNFISAQAVAKFLCDVYQGKLVNQEASEKMLTILKGQTVKTKIPSGLPEGYTSANKTGEMPEGYGLGCIENDCAIVWPAQGEPYILVTLSSELAGRNDEAVQIIRQISAYVAAWKAE